MSATTASSHTPLSAQELDQFRAQVRAFVAERLPEQVREKVRLGIEPNKADMIAWESELRDRGWLVPHWPREWAEHSLKTAPRRDAVQ